MKWLLYHLLSVTVIYFGITGSDSEGWQPVQITLKNRSPTFDWQHDGHHALTGVKILFFVSSRSIIGFSFVMIDTIMPFSDTAVEQVRKFYLLQLSML
jgi:hypothetical protein